MSQEFRSDRNVYLDRDTAGVVRQVLHTTESVVSTARTPQLAAADYLHRFGDLLGISTDQLQSLGLSPSVTLEDAPVEYRFFGERQQFDTTTVAYQQTDLGLPIWQAGLSVQLKSNPFRALSAQSTLHPEVKLERPSAAAVKRVDGLNQAELATSLGLDRHSPKEGEAEWDRTSLKIQRRRLLIYRYESANRVVPQPPTRQPARERADEVFTEPPPTLPLPAVPPQITEGQHYVCVEIDFSLSGRLFSALNWVALVEAETLSVLYLRAFVDTASGMVFEDDPVTTNGGPLPTASTMALNPVRVSMVLPGLAAPTAGNQALTGENVQLSDVELPAVGAPTEPTGTDFNFDARTDDFAAVNAYYHCDKFFRLLDGMGFTRAGFFGGSAFPSPVDHRGRANTTDGVEINAHCLGIAGGSGILQTTFMLAELGDTVHPIGLACDYRVVLHELAGHGVLYNHVSSANFHFSHSAGDGVAAILCDPDSQAADRFQTFPWVYTPINRRHDRTPAGGWGYADNIGLHPFDSTLDYLGYNNEQILSSTHFRIYQSIGGDSAELAKQSFAARMTVYLIMRAIGSLTPATSPADASGWASLLITADRGDWTSENVTGGAYGKVIRWAFEKQGLYQPAGTATPNNNGGAPPAVDVYIDDGRGGEYQYQPNWWSCQSIWNRRNNDGLATHEEPVTNQVNYAYVKIKNRGSQSATGVMVKAYHANPAAGLSYPIDWTPMNTAQLAAANVLANNASEITVGPFEWVPTHIGHECIFMIVSATGDSSNVNNIAVGDSIPEWRLTPNDNNVGQRNVFPISGGGTSGLTADFSRVQFELRNPHVAMARMEVRAVLPAFLETRGWKVVFESAGGASFPLGPSERRVVLVKLVPGADFAASDVAASQDKTIHLYGYAGGMVVGGLSFELDPHRKPSEPPKPHGDECGELAEDLLRCVRLPREKVSRVRIRKVNLDIEFEDECPE